MQSERGQVDVSDGRRSPSFTKFPKATCSQSVGGFFSRFHPSSVRLLIMNSFTEGEEQRNRKAKGRI